MILLSYLEKHGILMAVEIFTAKCEVTDIKSSDFSMSHFVTLVFLQ